MNRSATITLTQNAVFEPICTGATTEITNPSAILDTRDPFYSSVTPQLYAIGCATVVSYLLVVILLITPRTYYVGGPNAGGGGASFLGRHGMIGGSYVGGSSSVGVGGRPWLQKVAAILVAVSLTIASADSFTVAERQYNYGFSDAEALSSEVIDGLQIRIVRVISSTFLWLAQVQTLIRLFPRHKEKVMIKWVGFGLIVLDTTFAILDNFLVRSDSTRPRRYDDAIPALSYLFELSLNLLYAAWVIFYSLSKHRFAFFHPKMKNICLVALLSLCAVLIPIVFFVLDISKPDVAGWGSYIRWVGSAAASVVVWEWVERIEALERDERKDGILGREVFDGDEMLEVTPSEEVDWPRQPYSGFDRGGGAGASSGWGGMIGLGHRPLRTRHNNNNRNRSSSSINNNNNHELRHSGPQSRSHAMFAESRRRRAARPTPPPQALTPTSRADTTSAASTVYHVRYHPVSSPTPPIAMPYMEEEEEAYDPKDEVPEVAEISPTDPGHTTHDGPYQPEEGPPQVIHTDPRWRSILNPFRRGRASPPREVASAQAEGHAPGDAMEDSDVSDEGEDGGGGGAGGSSSRHEHRTPASQTTNRLFPFHRRRQPTGRRYGADTALPVTVIPARQQGQSSWSPQLFGDSSILESPSRPASIRGHHQSHTHNLPVRVASEQQSGIAAPWTVPDAGDAMAYELRYDPETAALVGPDVYNPSSTPQPAEHHHNTHDTHSSEPEQLDHHHHHDAQDSNSMASSEETYHVREQ